MRIEGKIKDPAQFGRIIVAQQGGGPVYLSQVADIIDGEKEETSIARINGRPAITIDILKAQDANIVETGDAASSRRSRSSGSASPRTSRSRSSHNAARDNVEKSVNRVKSTIVEGALLTVLIVFLFLHSWRSTIITGLTLPIAVIATFIALYAFGFTLNFLTLMALSLCIGLLIDDAIVVRENIVRHLAMGKDHQHGGAEGTDEIGLAVMATTFAIVAVFVPIAFMSGIIGRFFFQFGVTVAVAVMVSLFVELHARPDAVGGVARPARHPLQAAAVARPLHGPASSAASSGCTTSTATSSSGRCAHRKSVLAIAARGVRSASFAMVPLIGTEFVPAGRPGLHLAAPQHAGRHRASSTPTARCGRSRRR